MRHHLLKNFTLVTILSILSSPLIHADPITPEEAKEFEDIVRSIERLGSDQDLVEYFENKLYEVRNALDVALSPTSSGLVAETYWIERLQAQKGDTLHALGHFSEHKFNYEQAIKYHTESLEAYALVGEAPIRGSWNGLEHGAEHLFMDYYDWGVLLERSGKKQEAMGKFKKAREVEKFYKLHEMLVGGDRFEPRYLGLLKRFGEEEPEWRTRNWYTVLLSLPCLKGFSGPK